VRAVTLAVASVCAAIAAGVIAAWANPLRMAEARPALQVSAGAHGLTAPSGGLAPGDVLARTVVLTNHGANPLQSVSATVASAGSGVRGLQVRIDRCPTPWTMAGGVLVCRGRPSVVTGWQGMPNRPLQLAGRSGLAPGARLELRISVRLPAAAGNAQEGREGALQWTFSGA
jgi:hypothetical protein